jgi:hypothetical protein
MMALTLSQGAQLESSTSFRNRVKMAMAQAASDVAAESQGAMTSTVWTKRRQLSHRITSSPSSTLDSFVMMVAADPGSALNYFNPVLITSSTNANPSVVTLPTGHGIAAGDVVEIKDHLVNTNINGTWTVSAATATTITIPMNGNGAGGATGTVQEMETDSNLLFTVNSVYNAIAGIMPGD